MKLIRILQLYKILFKNLLLKNHDCKEYFDKSPLIQICYPFNIFITSLFIEFFMFCKINSLYQGINLSCQR